MTDRQAKTNSRAILDHSVDSVTGEKSLIWCLEWILALVRLFNVLWDIDVTKNGDVIAVAVTGIDGGTIVDTVAVVAPKLVLFIKNVAIVVRSILTRNTYFGMRKEKQNDFR